MGVDPGDGPVFGPRLARLAWLVVLPLLLACGEAPPSLVLVTLDTVRCDHLGIYGDGRGLSPSLDGLAARSLVYEHAYTTMPTTGPAHLSLFTGLYPSQHGSRENGQPLSKRHSSLTLALLLQREGYVTAAFVTTSLLGPRATGLPGFDVYDAPQELRRKGTLAAEKALAWLRREARRPVFLWLHLYDAHAPYGGARVDQRAARHLDPAMLGFVEGDAFANPLARVRTNSLYARGVRSADAALGHLLRGIEDLFRRRPLVVVAGDHGEALDEHLESRGYAYDHGEFLDEEVVCIPLVVSGPGVTRGRTSFTASLADLHTTLLATAGVGGTSARGIDLRHPGTGERIVTVERRRISSEANPLVRSHAVAAFDGRAGVVIGEDGLATSRPEDSEEEDLLAAARRQLESGRHAADGTSVDPHLQEALRRLGYVE